MSQVAERFEQETIERAAQLKSLMGHPHWETFMDLIELQEANIKEAAVYDDENPREYYKGMLDQLRALRRAIAAVLQAGEEISETEPLGGIENDIRDAGPLTPDKVAQIRDRVRGSKTEDLVRMMKAGVQRPRSGGPDGGMSGIS